MQASQAGLKERLRQATADFENQFGRVGRLLVVDAVKNGCGSSISFTRLKTNGAFYRSGSGRLYAVPKALSWLLADKESTAKGAYASRKAFYSMITLVEGISAGIDEAQRGERLDYTLFHELVHASEAGRQCLSRLKKHFKRFDDDEKDPEPFRHKSWARVKRVDRTKYLLKVVDEGLAQFVGWRYKAPETWGEIAREAEEEAEKGLAWVNGAVKEHWWARLWGDTVASGADEHYSIGLNFFAKVQEALKAEPRDYLKFLEKVPPNPDELLSLDGGRAWAERVKTFLA